MRPACVVLLLWAGCASNLGDARLRMLPQEERGDLLEAQSELAVASDRAEDSRTEVEVTRTALQTVEDAPKRSYLSLKLDAYEEKLKIDLQRVACAREGIALAKALTIRRAKLAEWESMDPAPLRERVERCKREVQSAEKVLLRRVLPRVRVARAEWEARKAAQGPKEVGEARPYLE
jgi:hypothetical protein